MKSFVVSTFVLVSLFIYDCEDSVSKNMTGTDRESVPLKKQVMEEINKQFESKKITITKKQPVRQALANLTTKKTFVQIVHKKDVKSIQSKTENNSVFTELGFVQKPLDLTLPLKIPVKKKFSNVMKSQRKSLFPDLFNTQKDSEKSSVQLVGKLIKRDEEGLGKDKTADGAGIDFKLTH